MEQQKLLEDAMSTNDRISTLYEKHATLEKTLDAEQKRPMPDMALVKSLKRTKLAIKDEIARLSAG